MRAFVIFLSAASLLASSAAGQVATLTKRPATATAASTLSPDEQLLDLFPNKLFSARYLVIPVRPLSAVRPVSAGNV